MIRNWLYCPDCLWASRKDVLFDSSRPPDCPRCGTETRQDWAHGQAPATDLGTPKQFDGLDAEFSSTRQAEQAAKERAARWSSDMQRAGKDMTWTIDGVAGDKRGGAREVRRNTGAGFSYRGQGSRQSTGERRV